MLFLAPLTLGTPFCVYHILKALIGTFLFNDGEDDARVTPHFRFKNQLMFCSFFRCTSFVLHRHLFVWHFFTHLFSICIAAVLSPLARVNASPPR